MMRTLLPFLMVLFSCHDTSNGYEASSNKSEMARIAVSAPVGLIDSSGTTVAARFRWQGMSEWPLRQVHLPGFCDRYPSSLLVPG